MEVHILNGLDFCILELRIPKQLRGILADLRILEELARLFRARTDAGREKNSRYSRTGSGIASLALPVIRSKTVSKTDTTERQL